MALNNSNSPSTCDAFSFSCSQIACTELLFITGHSLVDNPFGDYLASIPADKGVDYHWNQQNIVGSPIRYRTSGEASPPNNWQGYSTGKNRVGFDMDIVAELANPATIGYNPFNWPDSGLIIWGNP